MPATDVVSAARSERRAILTEVESKELLKKAGIGMVETRLARSKREAATIARELGFPVVLKIVSPQVVHKSDIGGVKLGLKSQAAVERAYDEIMAAVKARTPQAVIHGVSVQQQARPGVEMILGMTKDAQFGPVLMFGLGGVFVEVMKDVAFRIVPITQRDAGQMIREIKGFPLLEGYRGQEPVDISLLEATLLKLSDFIERHPEVKELDLNPVFGYRNSVLAVDARVVLEEEAS